MKNLRRLSSLFVMISMMLSLSSCDVVLSTMVDTDVNKSIKFAGQWTGDFGMYYDYRYMGRIYTFDSYDTDIVFYPEYDGATYGWGKQVDYYEHGPYSSIYNRFDWKIMHGVIYLNYYSNNGMDCAIYDYVMTRNHFSGRFGNSNDKFYLSKIADYYDWSVYFDDWFFYDNDDWYWSGIYYSNTRSMEADSISTPLPEGENKQDSTGLVSFGRRL